MSYQYESTKREQRAAALLRKHGWRVDEPQCPECHGMGFVWRGEAWGDGQFGGGSVGTGPCPRGCPAVSMYFPVGLPVVQSPTVVSDWPPCTCPKGNYVGDWICARHNPMNNTTGISVEGVTI